MANLIYLKGSSEFGVMVDSAFEYIRRFVEARERAYLFENIKVMVEKDIEDDPILQRYGLKGLKKGDSIEVPRWVAEILEEEGIVRGLEEGFEVEMFRVLNREKLQGPHQISSVRPDLYLRLRRYLLSLKRRGSGDAHNRFRVYAQDLIKLRLNKVIMLAASSAPIDQAIPNMTPEEIALYKEIHKVIESWKRLMIGDE